MRYLASFVLLLAIMFIACGGDGGGEAKDSYTLNFTPPPSVSYSMIGIDEQIMQQGTQTVVDTTKTWATHRMMITGDSGFTVLAMIDSVTFSRNGMSTTNPVLELLDSMEISIHLNDSGMAQSVSGYDQMLSRAEDELPEDQAAQLTQQNMDQLMAEQEVREWNRRYLGMVGNTVAFDEFSYDSASLQVAPQATITYYTALTLEDTMRVDDKLVGRVKLYGETSPTILAEDLGLDPAEVQAAYALSDSALGTINQQPIKSSTEHEWLVELATLLIHSETSSREIIFPMQGAQGQMAQGRITQYSSRELTYE